ncbi:hypothetical protein LGM42_07385 [Burkholderia sp. AU39826]|uniref:hypothetical protein n=1 Tax=Burkholderia sp. AU39826 TaxID=2879634 RepID=UPI001CF5D2AF|nr:hypothetical protein [Burkholderia sp. AU39826]MCA7969716.1 hypothetical protein [Burkholderia sp. AU39826]
MIKSNSRLLLVAKRTLILGMLSGLVACTATTVVDPRLIEIKGPTGYSDFIPQDPLPSPKITYFDAKTGKEVTKAWVQLSNVEIRNILSNNRAEITVGKFDAAGNLTYLVSKVTGSAGSYRVVMDYCEYVGQTVTDDQGNLIGQGRVGVGLRLTADVVTTKANVNLGSLLALGIAASSNQITGTMTVDSIGIRVPGGSGPILSNTAIDESSIQKTLESIAVIQSKIGDPSTKLDPQLLAVKPAAAATKPLEVAKKLI